MRSCASVCNWTLHLHCFEPPALFSYSYLFKTRVYSPSDERCIDQRVMSEFSPLPLRGACQRASIDVIEEVELQNPLVRARLREFMDRGAGASDPSE